MHNLEKLEIWRKAMDLVTQVYIVISNLPKDEQYGLTSQIKRCAISIPSNIAEGAGRNSNKEFIYFLGIAQGSSYELKTQLLLTSELRLITKKEITKIITDLEEIQKMNFSF
jgi:four helix bundle protein